MAPTKKESRAVASEESDHDLLIRIETLVEVLMKGHDNHLEHHRRRDIAMLSVMLGSILTSFSAIACAIFAYMK
jgi:hypothetical protein